MSINLYKIITSDRATFYVIATNPTDAAEKIKPIWQSWKYLGDAEALEITLVAQAEQYKADGTDYLIVSGDEGISI